MSSNLANRRCFLSGFGAYIYICSSCNSAVASSYSGCTLSARNYDSILGEGSEAVGRNVLHKSSGDKVLDQAIANTLARLTEIGNVLPSFEFYDGDDGNNAWASPKGRSGKRDGTVAFGLTLLRSFLQYADRPGAVISAVCAHEFGHIAQYKFGAYKVLAANTATARRVELHADFLAGVFAGIKKRFSPGYPAELVAQTQFNLGDHFTNHPDHHGTPKERGDAVVFGFKSAYQDRLDFSQAYARGRDFYKDY
jgi:hypothetical protein